MDVLVGGEAYVNGEKKEERTAEPEAEEDGSEFGVVGLRGKRANVKFGDRSQKKAEVCADSHGD